MVSGSSFADYQKEEATSLGVSPATIQPLLDYVLARVTPLIPRFICARPTEEMTEIMQEFYQNLGLDLPAPIFATLGYVGDGRHYRCRLPPKQTIKPADQKEAELLRAANVNKWGEDVNISGNAYSKISPKPSTKNKVSKFILWI